ncbi:MAG TPA: 4Fe-4S dicluster domain-containing protein [Kofleriaceae bacterium]|nr:4Fe-4S dicluster domain-containing protein [Kofleriaceae bacterium]
MTDRPPHRRLAVLPADPPAPDGDARPAELDRRELMKLLAAGASLAGVGGLAACMEPPRERIMPRVEQPPELVPGVPVAYATSMVIDGFATGLVALAHEARPTKLEGNPDHPASLGATSAQHQASVLDLYDPRRARGALDAGVPIATESLVRERARRERIPGLWFLLHPQSSPLVEDLIARVRARHPTARFVFDSPVGRREVYEGSRLAFGRPLEPQDRFERADVVVSLDADFLAAMPSSVRWSRDFARRRRLRGAAGGMSRLYVAEPCPTPTGSLADHRLPVRASEIRTLGAALLAAIEGTGGGAGAGAAAALTPAQRGWVDAAAADLRAGAGLVVVGDRQPREVHALAHLVNAAIGAIDRTVALTRPALIDPLGPGLAELATAMRAGAVQMLVIAEANPLYTAPPELALDAHLPRVPETLCAALDHTETSRRCRWFVPLAHYLESWGDARAHDGTISFIQPLIRPLTGGLSVPELLAAFAGELRPDGHRMLLDRYGAREAAGLLAWQRALRRGFLPDTAFAAEPAAIAITPADRARLAGGAPAAPVLATPAVPVAPAALELAFEASHAVHDGRFAGNAWLQELPKPLTKLTWGNAAIVSPATARALDVGTGDVVRIALAGRRVDIPVHVLPGHADGCATLELGYGRWAAGPVADGVGANVYRIRPAAPAAFAAGAEVRPTGRRRELAVTQRHFDQHGREIALEATLAHYRAHPDFTEAHRGPLPTLLPRYFTDPPQWGMTIDTMICSGCSACVVACQAENNIPVVGRTGVLDDREMHWLRIDTYREERAGDVRFVHQPMLCQHCEKAPCEYVCPVYATQHSPDGLNEMIYNRCIGTRFCSNNCPYKVRRFNWFDYTEDTPRRQQLQFNPSVTVRARGVMEKCTFCVQRIRGAEIEARKERREIRPGEVVTACQQACPTGAITFGLLHHADTDVVAWRAEPRSYAVLHELGTRPRVIYLAKITNPRT